MAKVTRFEAAAIHQARKTRVAAYARVSKNSDEQLLSLEIQKAHYEEYIKSNPAWEFAGLYYDEGISGTRIAKRERLLQLLEDCKAGRIDRVITKSISRFARNTTDCPEMVRKLTRLNISIYFEKENIDTDHMSSELMLSILSSIAESESRSISENNKWSVKHRFQNGTFIITSPPYGYQNEDGKMVVVPEEAEVVKDIYRMALNGKGCRLIAAELNKRGVPSRRGANWHTSTIHGILKNEKYTGDVIFQKTFTDQRFIRHINYGEEDMYLQKNHHEAIVSHEDFKKAAEAMRRRVSEKNIDLGSNKNLNRYSFSGKLICGNCGAAFKRRTHYQPSGAYIAWACNTHLADKEACGMKYIEDEQIKQAFIRMMAKLHAGHSVVLKPFIDGLRGCNNKEKLHQILDLESRLEKNAEQQKVLVELMASGYLEPDNYHIEKRALDIQAAALMKEKEQTAGFINGDLKHLEEAQKLLRYVSKKKVSNEFDDDLFLEVADMITINSRETINFNLKCGLRFEETLLKA